MKESEPLITNEEIKLEISPQVASRVLESDDIAVSLEPVMESHTDFIGTAFTMGGIRNTLTPSDFEAPAYVNGLRTFLRARQLQTGNRPPFDLEEYAAQYMKWLLVTEEYDKKKKMLVFNPAEDRQANLLNESLLDEFKGELFPIPKLDPSPYITIYDNLILRTQLSRIDFVRSQKPFMKTVSSKYLGRENLKEDEVNRMKMRSFIIGLVDGNGMFRREQELREREEFGKAEEDFYNFFHKNPRRM